MYLLNRNVFKAMTVEEAANHASYYKTLSWKERFKVAMYLNSIAFNSIAFKLVGESEPKLNKTVFTVRSRN
jgi:hypothetical protein